MFYQIFLSSQMERCMIITCKHGIDKLPQEVPNDLRLRMTLRPSTLLKKESNTDPIQHFVVEVDL